MIKPQFVPKEEIAMSVERRHYEVELGSTVWVRMPDKTLRLFGTPSSYIFEK